MRYDRARKNLDRHPGYILAAHRPARDRLNLPHTAGRAERKQPHGHGRTAAGNTLSCHIRDAVRTLAASRLQRPEGPSWWWEGLRAGPRGLRRSKLSPAGRTRLPQITPPDDVVDDILICSRGDLAQMIRVTRLAVEDSRDLRVAADALDRGSLIAPISFIIPTEIAYWSTWQDLRYALPVTLIGVVLFFFIRVKDRPVVADIRSGAWLVVYTLFLLLISALGRFGGPVGAIHGPWDSTIVAVGSIAIYVWAVKSGSQHTENAARAEVADSPAVSDLLSAVAADGGTALLVAAGNAAAENAQPGGSA